MNDTLLRYFCSLHFLWLVPNFRFIMITFIPLFLVYLHILLGLLAYLLYVSILISTAIFREARLQVDLIDGGRCRSLRYIPICVFLVAECARSPSPGAMYVLVIVNQCAALSLVPSNRAFLSLVTTMHTMPRGGSWTPPEPRYVTHAVNLITHTQPRSHEKK